MLLACEFSVVEATRVSFQTSLFTRITSSNTAAGSAFADTCFVVKAVFAVAETAAGQRKRGGHPAAERRGTIHSCSKQVLCQYLCSLTSHVLQMFTPLYIIYTVFMELVAFTACSRCCSPPAVLLTSCVDHVPSFRQLHISSSRLVCRITMRMPI